MERACGFKCDHWRLSCYVVDQEKREACVSRVSIALTICFRNAFLGRRIVGLQVSALGAGGALRNGLPHGELDGKS